MKLRLVLGRGFFRSILFGLLLPLRAEGSEPPKGPSSPPVTLTITFDRPEYFVGENVPLRLLVENTGDKDFLLFLAGNIGFKLTATDAAGRLVEDPTPKAMIYSVGGSNKRLRPGESHSVTLSLTGRCRIIEGGKYLIRVTPDPSWEKGWWAYPTAEATLSFKMPDTIDAERIVAELAEPESRPNAFGVVQRVDRDLKSLTLPVYLEPLQRRAATGDRRALQGIGSIRTSEATAALIQLAERSSGDFATDVFVLLRPRLPTPWPAANSAVPASSDEWNEELALATRALAGKWLAGNDARLAGWAAQMFACVGTASDAAAIFVALDRAVDAVSESNASGGQLNDAGSPVMMLSGAIQGLRARGISFDDPPPPSSGHIYAYFDAFRAKPLPRPENWRTLLGLYAANANPAIRNAAIASIPHPPPDDCVAIVQAALGDPARGVRETARFVAERTLVVNSNLPQGFPQLPQATLKLDAGGNVVSNAATQTAARSENVDFYPPAVASNPQDANSYSNRSVEKRRQRDFAGAFADADRAIALAPKNANAYNNRGLARLDLGDVDGAMADYSQAIALDPDEALPYSNRGLVKHRQGDFAGALADFDRAIDLRLDFADAFSNRGMTKAFLGDLEGAVGDCDHALVINPRLPPAFSNRGLVNDLKGDFPAAAADDAKGIELSKSGGTSEPYIRFRWSLVLRRQHQDSTPAGVAAAVAQLPAGWIKTVGRYLTGEISEGDLLTHAKAGEPKTVHEQTCEANYYAGMTHLLQNDPQAARGFFQRCVETGETSFDEFVLAKAELKRLSTPR